MNRLMLVAPLALAACNSQPAVSAKNASVAQVAAQVKASNQNIKFEPGEWANRTEILAFDMPGAKDSRLAEVMKRAMAKSEATTYTHCVTPDEANKPTADMFAGQNNGECRYDHFSMGGGKIDAAMTCNREGGTSHMAMNGSYTPTSFDMTFEMKGSDPHNPMGNISMKAHTTGARVAAACKTGDTD